MIDLRTGTIVAREHGRRAAVRTNMFVMALTPMPMMTPTTTPTIIPDDADDDRDDGADDPDDTWRRGS